MRISVSALFTPAIRRLDKLSYPYKLGLVGIGAVVAIAFFVISLHVAMRGAISDARDERLGLKVYGPVAQVMLLTQQHMTLAAGAAGEATLKPALQTKSQEIDTAIKTVDGLLAGDAHALALEKSWKNFSTEWQQLKTKAATLPAPQVLPAYQKLNALLENFMGDLGEASSLIRDPEHDTSVLADILFRKLPETNLQAGRLYALSIIPLQTRDMAEDWLKVAPQLAKSSRARADLMESILRADTTTPTLQAAGATTRGSIQSTGEKIDQMVDQEIIKGAFSTEVANFIPQTSQALAGVQGAVLKLIPDQMQQLLDARLKQLEARFWNYSIGAALIVLVLLYFSAGMFITILQSVSELSSGAQQIAEGNLAAQVSFSARDELRTVAEHFNTMVRSFAAIIREVNRTADGLLESSSTLAAASNTITAGSEQQSEASSTMAAAIEQMTVGVDEISRHASTAEEISRQSGEQSTAGCEVVRKAINEMENIATAVRASADVISTLGKNSAQINMIVSSIKEIADQTNMLALNASIEAARAGEDGHGFAVVADQVRGLAERTTEATQEITGMVTAIQNGTSRAVKAMQDGVACVHQGVELTNKVGTAMERVQGESGKVVGAVTDISHALREQSTASTEIAKTVENIARMAEENREEVTVLGSTAARLKTLSGQLANEIKLFRV
ncbi:methyl-accepting chemotaxis protein [Uliginosibacterium gangwonense]|uniref:methyl-accepting chemotaxis protein n=1 Tax=Uliginosibacterium gangwonense TaxID=392736 RepID=UPI000378C63F|nr:methyl-accepting chemotaxis protein [Uliginosibacterium gangwonense]